MKRMSVVDFVCAAVMLVCTLLPVDALGRRFDTIPERLDGSMMPYVFPDKNDRLVCPDSLTPFHIEYLGRHGARYLSSSKKVDHLLSLLTAENSRKNLTPDGVAFLNLLKEVEGVSRDRWGALSEVGYAEENRLGMEMINDWPTVFSPRFGGVVKAEATYVPRVVATMYTFCHALATADTRLEITASDGERYSPLLRFFQTDPDYRGWLKGEGSMADSWKPVMEEVNKSLPDNPSRRLFKSFPGGEDAKSLSMEMYGVLQGLRASGLGAPTTRWMSEDEYTACWNSANVDQWLKRSINGISTLPMRATVPLLLDFIGSADKAVGALRDEAAASPCANLRFGHAETLIPLASLMDLPGAASLPLDIDSVSSEWKNYEVSPLGANIMMVMAVSKTGNVYVALSHNSKPVIMPGSATPWQPWPTLRSFWLLRATL